MFAVRSSRWLARNALASPASRHAEQTRRKRSAVDTWPGWALGYSTQCSSANPANTRPTEIQPSITERPACHRLRLT